MTGFRGRIFETKSVAVLYFIFSIITYLFLNLFEFL